MVSFKCYKCGCNLFRIGSDKQIYCDKCLYEVGTANLKSPPIRAIWLKVDEDYHQLQRPDIISVIGLIERKGDKWKWEARVMWRVSKKPIRGKADTLEKAKQKVEDTLKEKSPELLTGDNP